MTLLAISPCPNDTFAFYALLHGKTSLPYVPEVRYADIEELNRLCFAGEVDYCKISFGAWPRLRNRYTLLEAGSALGFGCGPLLVARGPIALEQLSRRRIAVPGRHTTATLLLKLMLGGQADLIEMAFDRIMPAVKEGCVDAGLIIHESRFTYYEHGLVDLVDLGEWWQRTSGAPIPLGGIVAGNHLTELERMAFETALGESIDYAWSHRQETIPFMQQHAQEMEPEVMARHVDLYVNEFTRSLGNQGRAAIEMLVAEARAKGLV